MAQAPLLTVIFHGSFGAYREDGRCAANKTCTFLAFGWHAKVKTRDYKSDPVIIQLTIIPLSITSIENRDQVR